MDVEKQKSLKDLKTDLLGLVMSNPNQMNVNSLMSDYRNTVGSSIPVHKYGYTNVNTFLREECTDILKLSGDQYNPVLTPIVTEEVRHVNELIYKQKSSSSRRSGPPRRVLGVMQKTFPPNKSNQTSNSGNKSYMSSSNKSQSTNSSYSHSHRRNSSGNGYKNVSSESKFSTNNNYNYPSTKYNNNPTSSFNNSSSFNGSSFHKTNSNSNTLPKPLMNSPVTKPNPTASFKPNPISSSKPNPTAPSKTESQSSSNAETTKKSQCGEYPKNHRISDKLMDNLKELMTAYPSGLWCRELLHAYKIKYLVDLNAGRLGYNTLISLCRDLPMIFKITRPATSGDWRLFPPDAEIPPKYEDGADDLQQQEDDEETVKEFSVDDLVFGSQALPGVKINASLYPEDCAKYGECLHEPLPVPNVLLLQICEVRDPSHFWFQVISKSTSVALETLMDDMTEFYKFNPASKDYKMVRAAAMTGQLCAVPYGAVERYHRAIVIKNVSVDVVKVFYVDYGTVGDVEFSKLYMLLNDFCDVAVQGHRGRLGGVAPKGGQWSVKAKERFMELILEKQLQGQVLSRTDDDRNCVISLKLDDHYEEIDIGALLISEGLAVVDDGTSTMKKYFVSFDDLEEGKDVEIMIEDEASDDTNLLDEEEVISCQSDDNQLLQNDTSPESEDKIIFLQDVQKKSSLLPINFNNPLTDLDTHDENNIHSVKELDSPEAIIKNKDVALDPLARFADVVELNRNRGRRQSNPLEDGLMEYHKSQFLLNQQQQCYALQQQEYNKQFLNPYATPFLPPGYPQMGPVFPPMQQLPYPPMMDMMKPPLPLQQPPIPQFNNNMNNPPMFFNPQYNNNFWQHLNKQPPMGPNFPFARPPQMPTVTPNFQPQSAPNHIVRMKRSNNSMRPMNVFPDNPKMFEWDKVVKSMSIDKDINNSKVNVELLKEFNNAQCKLVNKSLDTVENVKQDKSHENVNQDKSYEDDSAKQNNSYKDDSEKQDKSGSNGDDLEPLSSDSEDEVMKPESPVSEDRFLTLTLHDVTDAFGEDLEIWSMKDKLYVILEQAAKAFFKNDDVHSTCKDSDILSMKCLYTILQDNPNVIVKIILSNIKNLKGSGVRKGGEVRFINNKEVDTTMPYIVLIPVERLFDALCSLFVDNNKYSIYELMEYTLELYGKYISSGKRTPSPDSENEDSSSADLFSK